MHFIYRSIFILFIVLITVSCSAPYRYYHNGQGYLILPFEQNQFRIEYYSDDPKVAEANWHLAANEICNNASSVNYQDNYTINSTFRSPVAGQMIDLPTQRFIHYGTVRCGGPNAEKVELIPAKWYTFNAKTGVDEPVSVPYIADTLKISPVKLFQLIKLQRENASAQLTKLWFKPMSQFVQDGTHISIWPLDGNGWAPNSLVLTERFNCLMSIEILPPDVLINILSKTKNMALQQLVSSGAITRYFLKIDGCDNIN